MIDSDQLLADLDESIPQGVPNSTRAEPDDDPFGLDELLSESMDDAHARAQYQADLKARKRSFVGMSQEEVAFCNSRMAAFELARIWKTDDAISIWAHYECQACGSLRQVFSRFMEHQVARHNPSTSRWVTVESTQFEAMPVKEIRPTPECARCTEWVLDPRTMRNLKEVLE